MHSKSLLKFLLIFSFVTQLCLLNAYEKPSYVEEQIWNAAAPYFIPEDHPMKKKLDRMFSAKRISSSPESLKRAGFSIRKGRKWDNIYLARHSNLKGYVLKIFTDSQMGVNEWDPFVRRVTGANAIREAIAKHGWKHLFKVPNKWIYPLPENPSPNTSYQRKHFILIAEDMNVFKGVKNEQRWAGPLMDGEKLAATFTLIKEIGLVDSVFPDNVPFSYDGRLAFIDTEHHHTWPIPYNRLLRFLALDMQHYWQVMINQDGP